MSEMGILQQLGLSFVEILYGLNLFAISTFRIEKNKLYKLASRQEIKDGREGRFSVPITGALGH